jgi:hypothetical protein
MLVITLVLHQILSKVPSQIVWFILIPCYTELHAITVYAYPNVVAQSTSAWEDQGSVTSIPTGIFLNTII